MEEEKRKNRVSRTDVGIVRFRFRASLVGDNGYRRNRRSRTVNFYPRTVDFAAELRLDEARFEFRL